MASDIIEHESPVALAGLIDKVCASTDPWGCAIIRRDFLRPVTNDAFILSIHPIMANADAVHVFYVNERNITILWLGKRKSLYLNLRAFLGTNLLLPGLNIEPSVLVNYADPHTARAEIKAAAHCEHTDAPALADHEMLASIPDDEGMPPTMEENAHQPLLKASHEQTELFYDIASQKPFRSQLHMLVVEDQIF